MNGTIPADFPYHVALASVSGVHPKLSLKRTSDGRYVSSHGDISERYAICMEMVQLLTEYAQKKLDQHPDWTVDLITSRVGKGLALKVNAGEWDVTEPEQVWVMKQVSLRLHDAGTGVSIG